MRMEIDVTTNNNWQSLIARHEGTLLPFRIGNDSISLLLSMSPSQSALPSQPARITSHASFIISLCAGLPGRLRRCETLDN